MPDVSIVVPFYNEADNIPRLIEALNTYFLAHPSIRAEVILVDDGSIDNSCKVIIQQYISGYSLRLIKLSKNFGSHAALRAGLLHSTGKFAMFLPADLQDPLTLVNVLLEEAKAGGFEVVLAQRKNGPKSFFERTFSRFYALLMQRFVSKEFPEHGFDIVLFSRKVIDNLNGNIEANSSLLLQILTMGFSQGRVSYYKEERISGKSKWTLGRKFKLLIDSFIAFSFVPIRMVTLIGTLFFVIGIVWTLYVVARKLLVDDLVSGWAMLTSILLLGFGLTNISLGIIAEYLWRTLDASRSRPVFIIDEISEVHSSAELS